MKKLILLLSAAAGLGAQTLTQTTFSQPVGLSSTQIQITSIAGLTAGQYVFSDREGMLVTGFTGTVPTVARGALGTRAASHGTTVPVYYGPAGSFTTFDQSGTCINPAMIINVNNGNVWQCPSAGGQWTQLNGGGGGGGGGSSAWGGITGTLSNQADLTSALNLKTTTPLSETSNFIYAAPCGSTGAPVWRLICAADLAGLSPSFAGPTWTSLLSTGNGITFGSNASQVGMANITPPALPAGQYTMSPDNYAASLLYKSLYQPKIDHVVGMGTMPTCNPNTTNLGGTGAACAVIDGSDAGFEITVTTGSSTPSTNVQGFTISWGLAPSKAPFCVISGDASANSSVAAALPYYFRSQTTAGGGNFPGIFYLNNTALTLSHTYNYSIHCDFQ